uniref:NAC domain-containing protein n=1 Tax=Fagus sylvatica TaxID=28930 RepID=A0A2N9IJE7_FAGSY
MEKLSTESLPLGFRFSPTDEELINHYLRLKNEGRDSEVQFIPEVDFNKYEPSQLPELSVIKSDKQWFFFCEKHKTALRANRAPKTGRWTVTSRDLHIKSRKSATGLIGTKKILVFHTFVAPPHGMRANWIMDEYDTLPARRISQNTLKRTDAFVLCRLVQTVDFPMADRLGSSCSLDETTREKLLVGKKSEAERRMEKLSTESLPLGFRFSPTDEELINHYLRLKNEGRDSEVQFIPEVDFNQYEPRELPELSVIKSDKQWFFFCEKHKTALRANRAFDSGYWKVTGRDLHIKSRKSATGLIGTKKILVFHTFVAPPHGMRANWIMDEYDTLPARRISQSTLKRTDAFVLCRLVQTVDFPMADRLGSSCSLDETTREKLLVGKKSEAERRMEKLSTESLPLGFRFSPTDEELINHYLRLKNEGRDSEVQFIPEVDFNQYEPRELPGTFLRIFNFILFHLASI